MTNITLDELPLKNQTPCKICIVRGMCRESCDAFLNHLILYLNINKLNEKDQREIANHILNTNKKLMGECE